MPEPRHAVASALEIRNLNVFYGASHALQGIDLSLESGVLSVVGRNGMGKTTLCNAIVGLVPVTSGTITFAGQQLVGKSPADIARLGIAYVPQGRRLWRSLSVQEHLELAEANRSGEWTIDRTYATFPRLAERRDHSGSQLSGGEQQMLAIARALLLNPRLLVMDEPTEGLAPVIVAQVEDMLTRLADESEIAILIIEQNIGVATTVSERVALMVNGRINRIIDSHQLAADRDLQQRLLGVGRHGHEDVELDRKPDEDRIATRQGPRRIYLSNPQIPTRWSKPVPVSRIEAAARLDSGAERPYAEVERVELRSLTGAGESVVLIAGTLDTKAAELGFIRDLLKADGIRTRVVDLSTTGKPSGAEVPPHQIAAFHPRGASGVFMGDRGQSVAGMTVAFERWLRRQTGIAGVIAAGGSGATAMVTPAMRALPVGIPKVMISTVASGDVRKYVGPTDIMMLHSVADVQGLNSITRQVLANGAHAMAGMVKAREQAMKNAGARGPHPGLPAVGLTMFGVTTPCVQQITAALEGDFDCLVFHATGIGGQAMEKLVDSGMLTGVIDITTTEVCDLLMGGILPATEDRFGAMIRARLPYVGSCGALDMVNFGPPGSVPEHYRGRNLYAHNPQTTLMRTTPEENARIGRWIGERLNRMEAPVRFFLPEGGVSLLDMPGQPFWNPAADAALFQALETTVRQTATRQLIRLPYNINDGRFTAAVVGAFRLLHGGRPRKRQVAV
jgi:uncharacterized protein (UPF0261 family)/ABC-type branched-subunit amino acid transport system ATPase component